MIIEDEPLCLPQVREDYKLLITDSINNIISDLFSNKEKFETLLKDIEKCDSHNPIFQISSILYSNIKKNSANLRSSFIEFFLQFEQLNLKSHKLESEELDYININDIPGYYIYKNNYFPNGEIEVDAIIKRKLTFNQNENIENIDSFKNNNLPPNTTIFSQESSELNKKNNKTLFKIVKPKNNVDFINKSNKNEIIITKPKIYTNRPKDTVYKSNIKVFCAFCKYHSHEKHTEDKLGPMYGPFNYKGTYYYIHEYCGLFSPNIYIDDTGYLENVILDIKICKKTLCSFCEKGSFN